MKRRVLNCLTGFYGRKPSGDTHISGIAVVSQSYATSCCTPTRQLFLTHRLGWIKTCQTLGRRSVMYSNTTDGGKPDSTWNLGRKKIVSPVENGTSDFFDTPKTRFFSSRIYDLKWTNISKHDDYDGGNMSIEYKCHHISRNSTKRCFCDFLLLKCESSTTRHSGRIWRFGQCISFFEWSQHTSLKVRSKSSRKSSNSSTVKSTLTACVKIDEFAKLAFLS